MQDRQRVTSSRGAASEQNHAGVNHSGFASHYAHTTQPYDPAVFTGIVMQMSECLNYHSLNFAIF